MAPVVIYGLFAGGSALVSVVSSYLTANTLRAEADATKKLADEKFEVLADEIVNTNGKVDKLCEAVAALTQLPREIGNIDGPSNKPRRTRKPAAAEPAKTPELAAA